MVQRGALQGKLRCRSHPPACRDRAEKGEVMPTGKLKMWNAERGFGFIQNDAGGPDMYLHASALKEANIDPAALKIGDPLTYDVSSTGDGKTKASNVQRA